MELEELPEDIQKFVLDLKYFPMSFQNDIMDDLEMAGDFKGFQYRVEGNIEGYKALCKLILEKICKQER